MSVDPQILEKLEAFGRRRRRLILWRGVSVAFAALLTAMMVVALADWLFVLPDVIRWILSGLAYLLVLAVEWKACVRPLLHRPDARELARRFELAEPDLREQLLAAVELGDDRIVDRLDSGQFRKLLQDRVSGQVRGLEIKRVLPFELVRRWWRVALGVGVCALALSMVSGFKFGHLMARALFPMANLARVSGTAVTFLAPTPQNQVVPAGDPVDVEVEVKPAPSGPVVLETFLPDGRRERLVMTRSATETFAATIQVGRETVDYRVRGGDAISARHRLDAAERPRVTAFHKTVHEPPYTGRPARTVREENGDLSALAGSTVDLAIDTDQSVRAAEVRITRGKETSTVPMILGPDGRPRVNLSLDAPGLFQVHLTAARTGFETRFSPQYEIRIDADLVPKVVLETPTGEGMIAPDKLVNLKGGAEDDVGLARVVQSIRINNGAWQETELALTPGLSTLVERRIDLLGLGVRTGDVVTVRLVATDLKGNVGESNPARLTMTGAGFDAEAARRMAARRVLAESLRELKTAAELAERQAEEARRDFERKSPLERMQQTVNARQALDESTRALGESAVKLDRLLSDGSCGGGTAPRIGPGAHGGRGIFEYPFVAGSRLRRRATGGSRLAPVGES